jgi:hypothetical protein
LSTVRRVASRRRIMAFLPDRLVVVARMLAAAGPSVQTP